MANPEHHREEDIEKKATVLSLESLHSGPEMFGMDVQARAHRLKNSAV